MSADNHWADLILVMEEKHKSIIKARFRGEIKDKALHVLDIADDFGLMDPELVEMILETAEPLIRNASGSARALAGKRLKRQHRE